MQSGNMMPTYVAPQCPCQVPPVAAPGQHQVCQHPPPNVTNSTKRTIGGGGGDGDDEDDDDIQFISEKPVKRQKAIERQPPIPMAHQPAFLPAPVAVMSTIPMVPMPTAEGDVRDAERRLSTGMVGFPSDLHAMEFTYALRGVSMPVLEKFTFNQPPRNPRLLSPPELSPKQLPSSVVPVERDRQRSRVPAVLTLSNSPAVSSDMSRTSRQAEKPAIAPNLAQTTPASSQVKPPDSVISSHGHPTPCSSGFIRTVCSKGAPMPPPPPPTMAPSSDSSKHVPASSRSPRPSEHHHQRHHHNNNSAHPTKQPCQACSRLRHQAQYPRPQALPMMNTALPPHFMPMPMPMPSAPCHPPFGQQIRPQMMAMPTNMHQYGPNFPPLMMPLGNNPFLSPLAQSPQQLPAQNSARQPPAHRPSPKQPPTQQPPPQQSPAQITSVQQSPVEISSVEKIPVQETPVQKSPAQPMANEKPNRVEKDVQRTPEPPAKVQPAQATESAAVTTDSNAASSPVKAPAFLIPPTYRKPSPNLIVDVAETCQEKFPFEEVAKRHNVTAEKVFDVFSAIIQVPLLRCPTDRRRPGKLATARIREYNKAKKAVQDAAGKSEGGKADKQGSSAEIAKKLGPVELPEGFTTSGEKS